MDKDLVEIDVGVGLSDSELLSYYYNKCEDQLIIELLAWDESIVQISFNSPILFIDHGCEEVTMFCKKVSESVFLKEVLIKHYDSGVVPNEHPYKEYQLLDLYENPSIEIICENIILQRKLRNERRDH